ncbi:MAG: membrane dipeptidase [Burkholderiales bacterium]|nr:membrane dipeptidase [Burkholderiales bacterium]
MTEHLARAGELLRESIVIDGLGGAVVHPSPHVAEGTYEQSLLGYGYTAINVTLVSEPTYTPTFDEVLAAIHENLVNFEINPTARHVEQAADILEAKKNNRLGVIFGLQSASCIGQDRNRVRILHKLGLRILQLTYMERNFLGDGCLEPENRGLTHFGIQVVRECNRLGILVDCSHVGIRTTLDAARHSAQPIVISHTAARALNDNPRCVTDDQMKAVAERGGVVGITPFASLIRSDRQPTIEDYVDHFDHALNVIGPDHVGFATDMNDGRTRVNWVTPWYYPEMTRGADYVTRRTVGFTRKSDIVNMVAAFVKRGYDRELVGKLLGGNFLRVMQAVWK